MDINCDMGESYGRFKIGDDLSILPYITSCNLACGSHGGDPLTIFKTMKAAKDQNKFIGAHPGYPDLEGFGRRSMKMSLDEFKASMLYQICALKGMLESMGGKLHHVKPHGALYHDVGGNEALSNAFCSVIKSIDPALIIYTYPGSLLEQVAKDYNLTVWKEGFADRSYDDFLLLVSRNKKNAMIEDPEEVANQAISILYKQKVKTISGIEKKLVVDTICLHGDAVNAAESAKILWHKINTD